MTTAIVILLIVGLACITIAILLLKKNKESSANEKKLLKELRESITENKMLLTGIKTSIDSSLSALNAGIINIFNAAAKAQQSTTATAANGGFKEPTAEELKAFNQNR